MATATVRRARRHAVQLIGVWPGDDFVIPQYDGLQIVVPPRTVVADHSTKGSIFRCSSARDESGNPIPGTVLLESDIGTNHNTGGPQVNFDALAWADGVESVGQALFARGFAIVDSVEEVAGAMEAGRRLWESQKQIEWILALDNERVRQNELRAKGRSIVAGPNDSKVREAVAGMRALQISGTGREAVSMDDIDSVLGVDRPAPRLVPKPAQRQEDDGAARARALILEAEESGVNLTKAELVGLLKNDAAIIAAVEEKVTAPQKAKA